MRRAWTVCLMIAASLLAHGVWAQTGPRTFRGAPVYSHIVVAEYPHDTEAYTQGLLVHQGRLYEGTGKYGRSTLREVDLETGDIVRRVELPPDRFGEGICVLGSEMLQLTWRGETGYVWDLSTFEPREEFSYEGEGWGLAYDGRRLILSDGSSTLRFLDPETRAELDRVTVWDDVGEVRGLNELEFINGSLYANVFPSDLIARIDTNTGQILGWIYLGEERQRIVAGTDAEMLNGIAWDESTGRMYVTGKYWPVLLEIEVLVDP